MKPVSLTISLIACCCALQTAVAQSPPGPDSAANAWLARLATDDSWPSLAGQPYGPPSMQSLPYGFLWDGYRGAAVEHDIFGMNRAPGPLPHSFPRPGQRIFSSLYDWLDGLLCHRSPPWRPACCTHCNSASCLPSPATMPSDNQDRYLLPAIPRLAPEISIDEIPVQEPAEVPGPGRANDSPQNVIGPRADDALRAPVVELAPNFVLPPEPVKIAPPHNRIPIQGDAPPPNVIPR